jgi:hypothetical protein
VDGNYFQLAYVTNDFDRGVADLRRTHGLGPFLELRDLTISCGPGAGEMHAHIALANKDGLQFELIQPTGGEDQLYRQLLPSEGYALVFHHLGRHFDRFEAFEAALAEAKGRWPVAAGAPMLGGAYAYLDARKDCGHHLELMSIPAAARPNVPTY